MSSAEWEPFCLGLNALSIGLYYINAFAEPEDKVFAIWNHPEELPRQIKLITWSSTLPTPCLVYQLSANKNTWEFVSSLLLLT